jgi:hypothetical protein
MVEAGINYKFESGVSAEPVPSRADRSDQHSEAKASQNRFRTSSVYPSRATPVSTAAPRLRQISELSVQI